MRSPKAHARQAFDRFPVLREAQRHGLRGRAVLARSEFFDQRPGVDSDRTGNGAHAVARAGLDPVVLILPLELCKHGGVILLARHLPPQSDPLTRGHGDIAARTDRVAKSALDSLWGNPKPLDFPEGLQ